MVLDRRRRQPREIARGDVGAPFVGPPVRIAEIAVVEPQPLGRHVHARGESFLGPRDALGQHDACVVPRQRDDSLQQIIDADVFARGQEHRRAGGGAVPFAPGFGANLNHLVELQLTALQHVERDIDGHHLRHRRGRHAPVGILRIQHRLRRQVDEVGNRCGCFERRRGRDDGRCDQDEGKRTEDRLQG